MKAKTIIQLLSLSTTLYAISEDEEMKGKISDITKKGKQTLNDIYTDFEGDNEEQLSEKLFQKAMEVKEEFGKRIDETMIRLYDKINAAHTEQLNKLKEELEATKQELSLIEARIVNMEMKGI